VTTTAADSIAEIVQAPCDAGTGFDFNLTTLADGSKALAVEWRFTGHGGYVGTYTIPADQFQTTTTVDSNNPLDTSQSYTGPAVFNITEFHNVVYF
jgi:hypothetical protein